MLLAKHCERAAVFFGCFADKGSIPYGGHAPWPYHENNGKVSMSAVLFSPMGHRAKEAQFFAKMAVAFRREASWHPDLVRWCDGSFTYDGASSLGRVKRTTILITARAATMA